MYVTCPNCTSEDTVDISVFEKYVPLSLEKIKWTIECNDCGNKYSMKVGYDPIVELIK